MLKKCYWSVVKAPENTGTKHYHVAHVLEFPICFQDLLEIILLFLHKCHLFKILCHIPISAGGWFAALLLWPQQDAAIYPCALTTTLKASCMLMIWRKVLKVMTTADKGMHLLTSLSFLSLYSYQQAHCHEKREKALEACDQYLQLHFCLMDSKFFFQHVVHEASCSSSEDILLKQKRAAGPIWCLSLEPGDFSLQCSSPVPAVLLGFFRLHMEGKWVISCSFIQCLHSWLTSLNAQNGIYCAMVINIAPDEATDLMPFIACNTGGKKCAVWYAATIEPQIGPRII